MRLTKHKKEFVKKRIYIYCKILNITVPNFLFLRKKDYLEWAKYRKEQRGLNRYRNPRSFIGIAGRKSKIIAVFIKNHPDIKTLDETIRHECIHLAKSYNHFSPEFYRWMQKLKKERRNANTKT